MNYPLSVRFMYEPVSEALEYLKSAGISLSDSKADVLVVRANTKVGKDILDEVNPEIVITTTHGIDHVDMEEIKSRGIKFRQFADSTESVAELAIGSLICLLRNVCKHMSGIPSGRFERENSEEAKGKTLGIVALGRIGRRLKEISESLGMKVLYYDPYVSDVGGKVETIEELVEKSDIISIHAPDIPSMKGYFNKDRFMKMKGKIIMNFGRGSWIVLEDLAYALENGLLKGAVLDVYETEPPDMVILNRLANTGKVVLTPHIGGSTVEARKRADVDAVKFIVEGDWNA